MEKIETKCKKAADYIRSVCDLPIQTSLVLGSGLGDMADELKNKTLIDYRDIPFFRTTSVDGHLGKLVLGELQGTPVAVLQGRFHVYEGISMEDIVFPIRVLAFLGIKNLILTNAAGGINDKFLPGDFVVITDHINLMGSNPLIGNNYGTGPRFPDMTHCWNPILIQHLIKVSSDLKLNFKKGIYAALSGPSYETPAEIRMLKTLGADMVGMSTVPEAIAAHHLGIKICGISCISNMAAGLSNKPLSHDDIKKQANKTIEILKKPLTKFISTLKTI